MDPTNPTDLMPERLTHRGLAEAVQQCRGCDLYRNTTQAVFGAGSARAEVMFVGEQPGDQEDRRGHPFVGPAGRELDRALEEAGIPRDRVYITNVVKHFKFERRGKRRIHKRPNAEQIRACSPWLEAEVELVKPRVIVALGATAAQALLGRGFRLTKERGAFFESPLGPEITATAHPSAILRAPDDEERRGSRRRLVEDLRRVAKRVRA